MNEFPVKTVIASVVAVLVAILFFSALRWENIDGSERIVWQKIGGVSESLGDPGLNVYFGWTTTAHEYYVGTDKFIISDKTSNPNNDYMSDAENEFNQPDLGALNIPVMMEKLSQQDRLDGKTTGPTEIEFECVMQYRLDPSNLVALHSTKTGAYRTTFIQPILIDAIKNAATVRDARSVYQGEGRVKLQNDIETTLKNNAAFIEFGVVVEKFVLTSVRLMDDKFLEMITKEARAEQLKKTAEKEKAAFIAQALAERERSMIEQKKRLVEAETQKQELIASEEAKKQQQILRAEASAAQKRLSADANAYQILKRAEADKNRNALEGEGTKLRKIAEAEGVLALGKAEANALKLKLIAYEGEGGRRFASVEIAKSLGEGIEKVYYIPSDMGLHLVAKDFNGAIGLLLDGSSKPIKKPDNKSGK